MTRALRAFVVLAQAGAGRVSVRLFDRGVRGHWVAVASIIALTIAGARAPIVNAPAVTSPSVLVGRELYAKNGCSACHSIYGKGGKIGPDLTHAAARRPDADWHVRHFRDPKEMVPGSLMPKIDLTDKELGVLADYMLSLK